MRAFVPLLLTVLALAMGACGDAAPTRRVSHDRATLDDGQDASGAAAGCVADPGGVATRYRVRPGDTLGGIALRIYGDEALWPEIARVNEGLVDSDGGVRAGDELVIPFAGR